MTRCGLRYARSRAKKEGSAPRKKKEKTSMSTKRELSLVGGPMIEKPRASPKPSQSPLPPATRNRKQNRQSTQASGSPDQSESSHGSSIHSAGKPKPAQASHLQERLPERSSSELQLSPDAYPPASAVQRGDGFFPQRGTESSEFHREAIHSSRAERHDWDRPPQAFGGTFERVPVNLKGL